MRIQIEHGGETVTIESPAVDIWEVTEVLRRALVAMGYSPTLADSVFDRNAVDDWGLGTDKAREESE